MLRTGIIGIGNTGNQVAALALEKLGVPAIAINSSENDLDTIADNGVIKLKISAADGLSEGTGKDRGRAKKYLKNSIMNILQNKEITEMMTTKVDVVFVVSSTGGGTGSGTAPLMTSILGSTYPDVKVILVGVTPVMSDKKSAHVNSLEYLEELYKNLSGITYMLYDNDRYSTEMNLYKILDKVNEEIVSDMEVISCKYNYATKYDSIDDQDMMRLISFPGRLLLARVTDIKEKDIDQKSIEQMIIETIKRNAHVETQRDKKVIASGVITNLSNALIEGFDNNMPLVTDFVGYGDHSFNHIYINEERKAENNVFVILSGLSPVNDKMRKIGDRIDEIEENQKIREEEIALNEIEVSKYAQNIKSKEAAEPEETDVDIRGIFDMFGA